MQPPWFQHTVPCRGERRTAACSILKWGKLSKHAKLQTLCCIHLSTSSVEDITGAANLLTCPGAPTNDTRERAGSKRRTHSPHDAREVEGSGCRRDHVLRRDEAGAYRGTDDTQVGSLSTRTQRAPANQAGTRSRVLAVDTNTYVSGYHGPYRCGRLHRFPRSTHVNWRLKQNGPKYAPSRRLVQLSLRGLPGPRDCHSKADVMVEIHKLQSLDPAS